MNKKIYTKWWFWVGVVVLVIIVWFLAGGQNDIQKTLDEQYMENAERKAEELREAYKNDPYGGNTPEETMELFVDALKKGDLELASRYYVVEQQDDIYNKLPQGVESGGINTLLDYYEDGGVIKIFYDYINEYEISVIKNKNEPGFTFRLTLNQETNKWKILDL